MDRYDKSAEVAHLRKSRDLYAEAFERAPTDYYTGINAAAKSVFLGEAQEAKKYADEVSEIVGTRPTSNDYWKSATAAEVQLILGQYEKAAELYRSAVRIDPGAKGSHLSTALQAKRLMNAMAASAAERILIQQAFPNLVVDQAPDPRASGPTHRRLRVFAFDPSASRRTETAIINEVVLRVPWESRDEGHSSLEPGPVGEYLEVVDYDPASGCFYDPVDLDDKRLLATDGLAPSEGDPRFHQQMVFGVAMNVIEHFEKALGRRVLWATHLVRDASGRVKDEQFVRRLRIYPHALREANAYYSPAKKALLFGYFPAEADDPQVMPGGIVFTCLSHDVVAHEMSHALLDGIHPRFAESSNPDVLAFHEAFADIVALFQHFSHPAVLEHQIARTRGDLASQNLLGQLAQEFGQAIGRYGALRDALGEVDPKTREWRPTVPDPHALETAHEPHSRGAILVAAIFDAFLTIYQSRVRDLLRIATQGSGILAPGEIHPDVVSRLAHSAAKTADHVLQICIRALDYCPPVDITFGDYLRAIITADVEMVPDDRLNYRLAFIEAFQRRGIYPGDVRTLSEESLVWRPPRAEDLDFTPLFQERMRGKRLEPEWRPTSDRQELWNKMRNNARMVHSWLREYCSPSNAEELGLSLSADGPRGIYRKNGRPTTEVHSVRFARRIAPDGGLVTNLSSRSSSVAVGTGMWTSSAGWI